MSFILQTYGDVSIKESVVLNAIEYITAVEKYVFNQIGNTTALNTVHSTLIDTYPTVSSGATAEAADYTNVSLTTPTRLTNILELVTYKFEVSNTQRRVSHYQGEDELSRQVQKGLEIWTAKAEFDLIRGTLASGLSGTAPVMSKLMKLLEMCYNKALYILRNIWNANNVVRSLKNGAIDSVIESVMVFGNQRMRLIVSMFRNI